jgi:hypothetical protein
MVSVIPGRTEGANPESSQTDFLRGSGFRIAAAPVVGPRFARTRWRRPE